MLQRCTVVSAETRWNWKAQNVGSLHPHQELCVCAIWWLWSPVCARVCIQQHIQAQQASQSQCGWGTLLSQIVHNSILSEKWSYPHMGFPAEPSTEAEQCTRAASAQDLALTWALQSITSWNNGLIWCIEYKNPTHFHPIYCDWH